MQLPRGTFQYIKKGMKLEGILEELQLMKFTGICTISFGSANAFLVLKSGKRILAEFRNIGGDAAWDELQKITGETVDASVSSMDDTQIELSLEFNKSCRIGKGGKSEQPPLSPAKTDRIITVKKSSPSSSRASATPIKNLQKPHIPEIPVVRPSVMFEILHAQEPSKTPENKPPQPETYNISVTIPQQPLELFEDPGSDMRLEETQHPSDTDSNSFDKDIDAFETMDVDVITSKIRGECKTLIKQLRLEHLTER